MTYPPWPTGAPVKPLSLLSSVDWGALTHAYGPAEDVPDQLRNLANDDPQLREQARHAMRSNVYHQGNRYTATAHTIPFVLGLLADSGTPERAELLELFLSLALGDYRGDLVPEAYRDTLVRQDAELDDGWRQSFAADGVGPLVDLACYEAAARGAFVLADLLDADDPSLRRRAVHAVGWFPQVAERTAPRLSALLVESTDPAVAADALLTLGRLSRQPGSDLDPGVFSARLGADQPLPARTAAAVSLAPTGVSAAVCDALLNAIRQEPALESAGLIDDLLWSRAVVNLAACQPEDRARVVAGLSEALANAQRDASLDVLPALLTAARRDGYADVPLSDLDPPALAALHALEEHAYWSAGDPNVGWAYTSAAVEAHGVPADYKRLCAYLGVEPRARPRGSLDAAHQDPAAALDELLEQLAEDQD